MIQERDDPRLEFVETLCSTKPETNPIACATRSITPCNATSKCLCVCLPWEPRGTLVFLRRQHVESFVSFLCSVLRGAALAAAASVAASCQAFSAATPTRRPTATTRRPRRRWTRRPPVRDFVAERIPVLLFILSIWPDLKIWCGQRLTMSYFNTAL